MDDSSILRRRGLQALSFTWSGSSYVESAQAPSLFSPRTGSAARFESVLDLFSCNEVSAPCLRNYKEVLWDCVGLCSMACPRGLQVNEEPGRDRKPLACRRSVSWFGLRLNIIKEAKEV
ncbi:hypothetical protein XENOCAPTIV_027247 [Xenoophorus captivus]|uniref:Uncharacterized protein n=1 Tax=Xenoophorus captivus TaxID=1517983 RepID=A0ABV0Q6E7_9TELE